MRLGWRLTALAAILLAAPTPACALLNSYSVKYALDVTLLVYGKPMTRHTVVRVTWRDNSSPITDPGYVADICGAGLLFDFGDQGTLLTPLYPLGYTVGQPITDYEQIPLVAFGKLPLPWAVGGADRKPYIVAAQVFRGTISVPEESLPQFIWVPKSDNTDRVQGLSANQLTSIGDPKIQLVSARAYSTSEAVIRHISPPPWLAKLMSSNKTVKAFANRAGYGPGIEPSRFEYHEGRC